MIRLRSKIVEIDAVLWDGINLSEVTNFIMDNGGSWNYVDQQLNVWNKLEKQLISCPVGHYVLKGLKGEFYPCEPEVLWMKYDMIGGSDG